MLSDAELRNIYLTTKTIAVVGLSDNVERPSYQVAAYLKAHSYQIIPVNPKHTVILGKKCYPDLKSVQADITPSQIDIVDIFRRIEAVSPHVDEAIAVGAKIVWLQEGITHPAAAARAAAAGLVVEMNRCLMKEHRRLFPS